MCFFSSLGNLMCQQGGERAQDLEAQSISIAVLPFSGNRKHNKTPLPSERREDGCSSH